MRSSPVEESRKVALEAAEHLLQKKGWKALTAASIAKGCGMSRQWLHALFGGQAGLIDALVDSVVGHWRSKQIEVIASRLPLVDTIEKSFSILLESSPTVGIVLRQIFVDRGPKFAKIWADINQFWSPVWQAERSASDEENAAAAAAFISSALALELLVRNREIDVVTAKHVLVAATRGCLLGR